MFCTGCADKFVPLPEQQLFEPVRVCILCHKHRQGKENELDAADVLAANMHPTAFNDNSAKHSHSEGSNDTLTLSAKSRTDSQGSDIDILVPHAHSKPIPMKNSPSSRRINVTRDDRASWQQNTSSPRLNPELSSSQISLHSNSSSLVFEGRNSQRTCSQESVNIENSAEGQRILGARAECWSYTDAGASYLPNPRLWLIRIPYNFFYVWWPYYHACSDLALGLWLKRGKLILTEGLQKAEFLNNPLL